MVAYSESMAGNANDRQAFIVPKTAAQTAANYTVVAGDFPLSSMEVVYDASLNVTVGSTATIPPNATLALPLGQRIVFAQGATGTTVVTAGAGVTLVGASATVAASTGRTCVQIALNKWFLY